MDEVDSLKKELARLNPQIDAIQRKLVLESKVRDAAQNLQRLYSTDKRPDTPQSPDSPHKKRSSLLPASRTTNGGANAPDSTRQADIELAKSVKKVDDLHAQMKRLLDRRQEVERQLLRHTSAVLAEEANRVAESAVPGVANGHHYEPEYDSHSAVNDFDGIRDILHGKPAGAAAQNSRHYEQQLAAMQGRLEQLNSQLRNVIIEAGQTLGKAPAAEVGLDQRENQDGRIENCFARLEQNLRTLEHQQRDYREVEEQNLHTLEQLERDAKAVEEQMHGVNHQLHTAMLQASDDHAGPAVQDPPAAGGHGYQDQLQYMEDGLTTLDRLLQQRGNPAELADAQAKVAELSKKTSDYDDTLAGLWDIIQLNGAGASEQDEANVAVTTTKEPFSLSAFKARVQRLYEHAQAAREQHDILRRQVSQQRELSGKSDLEKDRQIAEIQGRHDQLASDHGAVQQELANLIVQHEQTSTDAGQSRSELMKVMDEIEQMRRTVEQMRENEGAAETKHGEMHHNMEKLESEIVRLTTELTMARAELDGAYGTRAERAGAQAAEVESLNTRNKDMESELEQMRAELQDMANEFQEMTKESIAMEKERAQLDVLIDSLRDKCDSLEASLNDERVARIGLQKSEEKEARSMLVLKQEFKKMMREQKAEGAKLLRVCDATLHDGPSIFANMTVIGRAGRTTKTRGRNEEIETGGRTFAQAFADE